VCISRLKKEWFTSARYGSAVLQSVCLSVYLNKCNSALGIWCAGEPAEEGVCTERCRSSTRRQRALCPHHTGVASTTLAVSSETSGVQDCLPCAPVSGIKLRPRTSLPTFDSSVSMVVVLSAHLPTGHSLFHGHAAVMATEALLLQDHTCGTVYLRTCDRRPAMDSSGDIWNHIYLGIFRNQNALWLWFRAL